jgi:chromosome segregation ATPase
MHALYRLQTFQSQATTQLVDQAQALHLTVQLRDEQLCEASEELDSRGALITQLESQVQELQDMVMDRDATLHFLEDQFHDLQLDLDNAKGQLHQMQDALHVPPGQMQVDGEEEPQEI